MFQKQRLLGKRHLINVFFFSFLRQQNKNPGEKAVANVGKMKIITIFSVLFTKHHKSLRQLAIYFLSFTQNLTHNRFLLLLFQLLLDFSHDF